MIDTEFTRRKPQATILTSMIVASKQIATIKADSGARQPIVLDQSYDSRHLHRKGHRSDELTIRITFILLPPQTQFAPGSKIVIGKLTIFNVNHFGNVTIDEAHRATHVHNMNSHIRSIEYQNARLKRTLRVVSDERARAYLASMRMGFFAESEVLPRRSRLFTKRQDPRVSRGLSIS